MEIIIFFIKIWKLLEEYIFKNFLICMISSNNYSKSYTSNFAIERMLCTIFLLFLINAFFYLICINIQNIIFPKIWYVRLIRLIRNKYIWLILMKRFLKKREKFSIDNIIGDSHVTFSRMKTVWQIVANFCTCDRTKCTWPLRKPHCFRYKIRISCCISRKL